VGTDARTCRDIPQSARNAEKEIMLYYAATFLFFGLVAGGLNWAGIATVATQSSWILFASGMVLLMIHMAAGRAGRVS
jgi:uncharacterized membrane protein YtjA (UPF0391 family)